MLLATFFVAPNLFAQNSDNSYYEEQIRSLTERIRDMERTQVSLVQSINKLQQQNNKLYAEIEKLRIKVNTPIPPPDLSSAASVTSVIQLQESVVALEKRVSANDKKRESDSKMVLEQLDKLSKIVEKLITQKVKASVVTTPVKDTSDIDVSDSQKLLKYQIVEGDTLSGIVKKFKAGGRITTVEAIQKANPKIKANSIKVGSSIYVPVLNQTD